MKKTKGNLGGYWSNPEGGWSLDQDDDGEDDEECSNSWYVLKVMLIEFTDAPDVGGERKEELRFLSGVTGRI